MVEQYLGHGNGFRNKAQLQRRQQGRQFPHLLSRNVLCWSPFLQALPVRRYLANGHYTFSHVPNHHPLHQGSSSYHEFSILQRCMLLSIQKITGSNNSISLFSARMLLDVQKAIHAQKTIEYLHSFAALRTGMVIACLLFALSLLFLTVYITYNQKKIPSDMEKGNEAGRISSAADFHCGPSPISVQSTKTYKKKGVLKEEGGVQGGNACMQEAIRAN